jgi:hypothetical protein
VGVWSGEWGAGPVPRGERREERGERREERGERRGHNIQNSLTRKKNVPYNLKCGNSVWREQCLREMRDVSKHRRPKDNATHHFRNHERLLHLHEENTYDTYHCLHDHDLRVRFDWNTGLHTWASNRAMSEDSGLRPLKTPPVWPVVLWLILGVEYWSSAK